MSVTVRKIGVGDAYDVIREALADILSPRNHGLITVYRPSSLKQARNPKLLVIRPYNWGEFAVFIGCCNFLEIRVEEGPIVVMRAGWPEVLTITDTDYERGTTKIKGWNMDASLGL